MATQDSPADVSLTLLAAQARLLELRRAHQAAQATRPAVDQSAPDRPQRPIRQPAPTGAAPAGPLDLATLAAIANLPPHLGWGDSTLTALARRTVANHRAAEDRPSGDGATPRGFPLDSYDGVLVGATTGGCPLDARATTPTPTAVKVYPDVALAMLRRKQTAAGRVWLLLRHLDANGRGSLSETEAYTALAPAETRSAAAGPLAICGRRQLDNLLRQGDGLFWERSTKPHQPPRIWLRSVARVAAALGVERLGASPVAVDITALTASIGQVRAHLYAAFHSSRQRTDFVTGRHSARAPIARETLQRLSAASPNSQRAYERRAKVERKAAFAVGAETGDGPAHKAAAQETAWQHGRATFRLIDHDGRYGRPGRSYLAWQLPNEYTGPHQRLSRSRMKRMNRVLADLLVNGMTGNDERDAAQRPPAKRFFGNAKSAQAAERKGKLEGDGYWRLGSGQWSVVSGQWSEGKWSVGKWSVASGQRESGQWSVASGQRESGREGKRRHENRHHKPITDQANSCLPTTSSSLITANWPLITANRPLATSSSSLITDHRSLITPSPLTTDHRPLTTSSSSLITDH